MTNEFKEALNNLKKETYKALEPLLDFIVDRKWLLALMQATIIMLLVVCAIIEVVK